MATILVIDDEIDLLDNVRSALELNKYKVYTASTGKQGYNTALQIIPDLIICDVMMPDEDGFWVLKNIRDNKSLQTIPFIFLTAKVERDDLRKGMNLGADDYITKPFKIADLLQGIQARLTKSEMYKSMAMDIKNDNVKVGKDKFILLDTGKTIEPVQANQIECIFADNIYTRIFLSNKKFISVRKSLNEWENILPDEMFLRIHRGTIINLNMVRSIEKWFNQTMLVHMQNYDETIKMSRSYTTKFKDKLIL